jgi:RNA polymerase sigma factor (sigma-70 family)
MSHPSSQDRSGPDASIDWIAVRSSLRRRLGGRLDPAETAELDDLVQEGCVRLLRASRREPIDDPEAMIAVIAQRTFRDWLRRRYRNERLCRPLDGVPEPVAPPPTDPRYGDLIERIEFLVLEIFDREGKDQCAELARGWFAGRNWKQLSERIGISHATARKRWSRCLELPRRVLGSDPTYAPLFRRLGDG